MSATRSSASTKYRELGLTDHEYELIVEQLGREPGDVELAMFSLMWSEHCAYKHSRKLLRRLLTDGPSVVLGPGENAGAVDVGDGLAVAFKVESHNHPSAVEPFQGAATGVGALPGRDGIGGASVLASAELGDGDEAKRPSVQIGDPFTEKKLLECCLELLDDGLLVSLQDLGAAGLTSSASEMASKGQVGIDIDVYQVPLREPGMEPFEIMISESQERMLCVVEPERVGAVMAVCERWEVLATPIGSVTDTGHFRVLSAGNVVADLPVHVLVDDCPLYDLNPIQPALAVYPAPQPVLTGAESPR